MRLPIKIKTRAVVHPGPMCVRWAMDTVDELEELLLLWSKSADELEELLNWSELSQSNPRPCM